MEVLIMERDLGQLMCVGLPVELLGVISDYNTQKDTRKRTKSFKKAERALESLGITDAKSAVKQYRIK